MFRLGKKPGISQRTGKAQPWQLGVLPLVQPDLPMAKPRGDEKVALALMNRQATAGGIEVRCSSAKKADGTMDLDILPSSIVKTGTPLGGCLFSDSGTPSLGVYSLVGFRVTCPDSGMSSTIGRLVAEGVSSPGSGNVFSRLVDTDMLPLLSSKPTDSLSKNGEFVKIQVMQRNGEEREKYVVPRGCLVRHEAFAVCTDAAEVAESARRFTMFTKFTSDGPRKMQIFSTRGEVGSGTQRMTFEMSSLAIGDGKIEEDQYLQFTMWENVFKWHFGVGGDALADTLAMGGDHGQTHTRAVVLGSIDISETMSQLPNMGFDSSDLNKYFGEVTHVKATADMIVFDVNAVRKKRVNYEFAGLVCTQDHRAFASEILKKGLQERQRAMRASAPVTARPFGTHSIVVASASSGGVEGGDPYNVHYYMFTNAGDAFWNDKQIAGDSGDAMRAILAADDDTVARWFEGCSGAPMFEIMMAPEGVWGGMV